MKIGPEIVNGWARELSANYTGSRVKSIESGDNWITINLGRQRGLLFFSWSPAHSGCCVAEPEEIKFFKKLSPVVSSLESFLKKHILNASLSGAEQLDRDRILKLVFERRISAGVKLYFNLILEAAGNRGNLIITDDSGRILECAKHIHPDTNRYRSIVPGHQYTPPPPVRGRDIEDFASSPEISEVSSIKGISRDLGRLILGNKELHSTGKWTSLLLSIYDNPETCLNIATDNLLTFFPEVLPRCKKLGSSSLLAGRQAVLIEMINFKKQGILKRIKTHYDKKIKSKTRHLDGLTLQKHRSMEAEGIRKKAELILQNLHLLHKGQNEVILQDLLNPEEAVTVALDPGLTPVENSQVLFRKYKKSRKGEKNLDPQIRALNLQIKELSEQKETLEFVDDLQSLYEIADDTLDLQTSNPKDSRKNKNAIKTPPHIRKEMGGYLILAGLNARGNRYVTFDIAGPEDLWLHAYEAPGAHVIIKEISQHDPDLFPFEKVLETAASLAAYYSKLRNSGKARVIYTQKKNVRHIRGGSIAEVTYKFPESVNINPLYWKTVFEESL